MRKKSNISAEEAAKNPEEYVSGGFYKDPELKDLTIHVFKSIASTNPGLYFHYDLHEIPGFDNQKMTAAANLVMQDPLAAILMHKIHKIPEFAFLKIPLLYELTNKFSNIGKIQPGSEIANEISSIVNDVYKQYPYYFIENAKNFLPRTQSGESDWENPVLLTKKKRPQE